MVSDGADGAEAGTAVRTTFPACYERRRPADDVFECVLDSSACRAGERLNYASESSLL